MALSDKKLNAFQKGILQKYFSLATYGVCIIATAYAVAFLIKNDILKALTAIQKQAGLSDITFRMLTDALDERGFALASIIIFSSVLLALASWFTVRWAGNRNWSTPVILPCAVEFRSAMDRLGVQKPRDRFDIIEKFRIPLYLSAPPSLRRKIPMFKPAIIATGPRQTCEASPCWKLTSDLRSSALMPRISRSSRKNTNAASAR